MNSRIYNGKIMHARKKPIKNYWEYPFYFYAIDLDELPELNLKVFGFGYNCCRPVSLHDSDYLKGSKGLQNQLEEYIDTTRVDRVIMITMARFMTKVFNPVSFYMALRADGSPDSVLVEVNNTFGERHLYPMLGSIAFPLNCRHGKEFHVSPFNNMDGHYEFMFTAPDDDMRIEIKLIRDGEAVMNAAMWGKGKPITTANLWHTIFSHPFTAALTMPRILWHAAQLKYKMKLPVYKKPAPSNPMTITTAL